MTTRVQTVPQMLTCNSFHELRRLLILGLHLFRVSHAFGCSICQRLNIWGVEHPSRSMIAAYEIDEEAMRPGGGSLYMCTGPSKTKYRPYVGYSELPQTKSLAANLFWELGNSGIYKHTRIWEFTHQLHRHSQWRYQS